MSEYQLISQQTDTPPPLSPYRPGATAPRPAGSTDFLAGTTQVDDPAALKQAGHGALELAGTLNSNSQHADQSTDSAATALKGANWGGSLGNALRQSLDTWHQQAVALVRSCRDIHDKCSATADNYTSTETDNTQNLSAVRTQSPFG